MTGADVFATLFILYEHPNAALSRRDEERLSRAVRELSGLRDALAFTPMPPGDQPFASDGRGPALALQLDFETSADLDAALVDPGPLADVVRPGALPSLADAFVAHQCMIGRRFATPDPDGPAACTFLVDYPGSAEDLERWLDHYDAHHPPIMTRFPGVRVVATYRPAPEIGGDFPCARATSMQRNKVVFDTSKALVAALASPVMAEMRADSAAFP